MTDGRWRPAAVLLLASAVVAGSCVTGRAVRELGAQAYRFAVRSLP